MKEKYKTFFKEDTYMVHTPKDAKNTISDLAQYIIKCFPEPKSLFTVAEGVTEALRIMFPDEAEYKAMKTKVIQGLLHLD